MTARCPGWLQIEGVGSIIGGCPRPTGTPGAKRLRLRWIAGRLRWLKQMRAEIASSTAELRSIRAAHRSRVAGIDAELAALDAERHGLRAEPPRWPNLGLDARLEEPRQAAAGPELDRRRLNAALRAVLAWIRIDPARSRMMLGWRHGGTSEVVYLPRKRARPGPSRRDGVRGPKGLPAQPG